MIAHEWTIQVLIIKSILWPLASSDPVVGLLGGRGELKDLDGRGQGCLMIAHGWTLQLLVIESMLWALASSDPIVVVLGGHAPPATGSSLSSSRCAGRRRVRGLTAAGWEGAERRARLWRASSAPTTAGGLGVRFLGHRSALLLDLRRLPPALEVLTLHDAHGLQQEPLVVFHLLCDGIQLLAQQHQVLQD